MTQEHVNQTKFRDRLSKFVTNSVGIETPNSIESQSRSATDTDTDVVVIGSSIVHMARALTLAAFGARVTVLDQRENLGGVWSTIDTVGLRNVERAPHIFMPCARAYRFIEQVLETELIEIEPAPRTLTIGETGDILATSAFPGTEKTAHPHVIYEGDCKHPAKGTNALINHMFQIGRGLGIQYVCGTRMTSLKLESQGTVLAESFNKKIRSRRAIISRGSPVVQFHDGQSQIVPFRSSTNVSLHLLIQSDGADRFSFIHVDGHPFIKEIHDISECTAGLKPRERLIIIKLRYNIFEGEDLKLIDSHTIFSDLISLGLFDVADHLLASQTTGYEQTRLTEAGVAEIQDRYARQIDIVPFATLDSAETRADLCAQDMSVALSAPEFYKTLLQSW